MNPTGLLNDRYFEEWNTVNPPTESSINAYLIQSRLYAKVQMPMTETVYSPSAYVYSNQNVIIEFWGRGRRFLETVDFPFMNLSIPIMQWEQQPEYTLSAILKQLPKIANEYIKKLGYHELELPD